MTLISAGAKGAAIAGDPARSPPLSNNANVLSVAVVLRIGDIYYLRARKSDHNVRPKHYSM